MRSDDATDGLQFVQEHMLELKTCKPLQTLANVAFLKHTRVPSGVRVPTQHERENGGCSRRARCGSQGAARPRRCRTRSEAFCVLLPGLPLTPCPMLIELHWDLGDLNPRAPREAIHALRGS